MRQLLVLVALASCGGGGSPATTAPIDNTATAQPAQKRCTVIPAGNYSFAAAPTEETLMDAGEPAGRCTTGFAGSAQEITCQQASPEVRLQGTFDQASKAVHFKSATFSGELQYSDAVVLLGGLADRSGKSLFVRLELECKSIDECYAAMEKARTCQ